MTQDPSKRNQKPRNGKPKRLLQGSTFAIVLVALGGLAAWKTHTTWQQISCGVTLSKAWHIAFSMYCDDHPSKQYPPMSSVPGHVFLNYSDMCPTYATEEGHPLFCAASDRAFKSLPLKDKFAQSTYVYLGYALRNEDEMLAFLEAYSAFIEQGVDFKNNLPAPKGRGSFGGDQFLRLSRDHGPDGTTEKPRIPVMFETPDYTADDLHFRHARPGGYVSFLDGGAGFVEYGKEFPMTPVIIEKIGEIKARYRN